MAKNSLTTTTTKPNRRRTWRDRPIPSFFDRHKSFLKVHREEEPIKEERLSSLSSPSSSSEFFEVFKESINYNQNDLNPFGIDQVSQLVLNSNDQERTSPLIFESSFSSAKSYKIPKPSDPEKLCHMLKKTSSDSESSRVRPENLASILRQKSTKALNLVNVCSATTSKNERLLKYHDSPTPPYITRNSVISTSSDISSHQFSTLNRSDLSVYDLISSSKDQSNTNTSSSHSYEFMNHQFQPDQDLNLISRNHQVSSSFVSGTGTGSGSNLYPLSNSKINKNVQELDSFKNFKYISINPSSSELFKDHHHHHHNNTNNNEYDDENEIQQIELIHDIMSMLGNF
ncbi:hypothetical protein CROQUDRAFT_89214 [Cronartium quercuum f. sp. fusiforme G11]|uniref:Uncharacterized protein n=1 Tax=Cronartium quercuum f. sp. fusiforme G11 TaxID=708437 RepID=A0A9P6NLQ4_9BASI|nr:hypothetical protein CROQUDRAFT_89214 [Cronartium quercuum f. sp. fusiforme G11]